MKQCVLTLAFLLAAVCLSGTALAYDWLPENVESLTCELEMECRPGVVFQAYRVCTVNRWVEFTPTPAFSGAAARIGSLCNGGNWNQLLAFVQEYMVDKQIEPEDIQQVEDGKTSCTFPELPAGLYLITGYQEMPNGETVHTVPFLICLPNWLAADDPRNTTGQDTWVYKMTAAPKPIPETPDRIKVSKIWDKSIPKENRLDSVTVTLWQVGADDRGQVYDEVELSEENHWQATWEDLPPGWSWVVRETDGSQGFRPVIKWWDEYNVTVTNKLDPDDPKNDPDPDPDDDPPPGPPNIPDEEIEDDDPPLTRRPEDEEPLDEEDIEDDDPPLSRLPQTGVLWWPVPFLAMGGMFLFVLGWALNRRERSDEE